MAEYYEGMGRRSGPPKRTVAGILFGGAMALFSALAAAVTVLTFAAPYVNPASCWIFSILGLAAPVIYLLTVLLALYWIVRWRWGWASVMLVLVVVGLFKVSLFYKPEFRRVYDDTPVNGRGTIRFMTYNVRNFYSDDGRSSVAEILRMVEETDPDIVCIQEFNPALAEETAEYRTFLENYPYSVGGAAEDPRTAPLAIFSKFRTIRWGMAHPELQNENARESIWADLRIGDDTVRVFNNHLHSTAINASDNEFITKHRYISDTAREDKLRSIVRRFRDNSILRARQVESIAGWPPDCKTLSARAVWAIRSPSAVFSIRCASTTCWSRRLSSRSRMKFPRSIIRTIGPWSCSCAMSLRTNSKTDVI